MPSFILGPKELNKFSELFALTDKIDKIYIQLYKLEISGKKNSNEYNQKIEELKKAVVKERKAYDDELLTDDLCQALSALALQTMAIQPFTDNIESLVTNDKDNRKTRRVLNKLSDKIMNNPANLQQSFPDGLMSLLKALGVDDTDKMIKEGISTSVRMHQAFDKDVLSLFLSYVEEKIDQPGFSSLKDKLIKIKYTTSFITEDIERDMITSKFTVLDSIYVSSKFVADVLHVTDEAFIAIKNIYNIEIADNQMNGILAIDDYNYTEESKTLEAILRQSLLRANLFLISQDDIEGIKDNFQEYTNSQEYLNDISRKISTSIIDEAFKVNSKDKSKHKVLSLRPTNKF